MNNGSVLIGLDIVVTVIPVVTTISMGVGRASARACVVRYVDGRYANDRWTLTCWEY